MTTATEANRNRGFLPYLAVDNGTIPASGLSRLARERRRKELGIYTAVNNRPALASYDEPEAAAKAVFDPVHQEALRLAERIRNEHKNAQARCDGDRNNFIVPGWSDERVLYGALAILNKEGLRLGSMSVADEGCWKMWFYALEPEEAFC
jgi:hypothetical protein